MNAPHHFVAITLVACAATGCIPSPPGAEKASPDGGIQDGSSPVSDAQMPRPDVSVEDGGEPDVRTADVGPDDSGVDRLDGSDGDADVNEPPEACSSFRAPYLHWSFDSLNSTDDFMSSGVADLPVHAEGAMLAPMGLFDGALAKTASASPWIEHAPELELPVGTITMWFRLREVRDDQDNGIFSKDASGDALGHMNLTVERSNGAGRLYLRFQHNNDLLGAEVRSDPVIIAERWYQAGIRWDALTVSLFLDGAPVGSDLASFGLDANTEPIGLGFETTRSSPGSVTPTGGQSTLQMDELVFWDVALSDSELQTLFAEQCSFGTAF